MPNSFKSLIVANRRRPSVSAVSRYAKRFLNAFENTGEYDFDTNGEAFALRVFASKAPPNPVIWDVGAHYGEYAEACHNLLPTAQIVSFEILPPVARLLHERIVHSSTEVINIGLSDAIGAVDVIWNKRSDTTNSIAPLKDNAFFAHDDLETVSCPVSTVDQLVDEGRTPPHFLKIDVEGHEAAVLRGAQRLLSSPHAPVMIQFEYGQTWIAGGSLLYHTQILLEEAGYRVGRLYPDHVGFKDFDWQDEHFRMGNYIAVKDSVIISMLE